MGEAIPGEQDGDERTFSKPFIACLIVGTILETAGILIWQFDENYYLAAMVLLVAGMLVEVYGLLIKMRENKER